MVYGSFLPRMPLLLAGDSAALLGAGKSRRNSFHNICLREGPGICIFPSLLQLTSLPSQHSPLVQEIRAHFQNQFCNYPSSKFSFLTFKGDALNKFLYMRARLSAGWLFQRSKYDLFINTVSGPCNLQLIYNSPNAHRGSQGQCCTITFI